MTCCYRRSIEWTQTTPYFLPLISVWWEFLLGNLQIQWKEFFLLKRERNQIVWRRAINIKKSYRSIIIRAREYKSHLARILFYYVSGVVKDAIYSWWPNIQVTRVSRRVSDRSCLLRASKKWRLCTFLDFIEQGLKSRRSRLANDVPSTHLETCLKEPKASALSSVNDLLAGYSSVNGYKLRSGIWQTPGW